MRKTWGVRLTGQEVDLADWADHLKQPFDPWVDKSDDDTMLRWAGFDALETASEVYDAAGFIVDQLNGAMAAAHNTRRVDYAVVIEFRPDGRRVATSVVAAPHFEGRSRVFVHDVKLGPDGQELPPPPPQPSVIQRWLSQAANDESLAHALAHNARSTWYETYKTIECLEDRAGGERALRALNWLPAKELEGLKRTANSFRHRTAGKHSPPPDPVTLKQAREMLRQLIRSAFDAAK